MARPGIEPGTPRFRERIEELDACRPFAELDDFVEGLDVETRERLEKLVKPLGQQPEIARRRPQRDPK